MGPRTQHPKFQHCPHFPSTENAGQGLHSRECKSAPREDACRRVHAVHAPQESDDLTWSFGAPREVSEPGIAWKWSTGTGGTPQSRGKRGAAAGLCSPGPAVLRPQDRLQSAVGASRAGIGARLRRPRSSPEIHLPSPPPVCQSSASSLPGSRVASRPGGGSAGFAPPPLSYSPIAIENVTGEGVTRERRTNRSRAGQGPRGSELITARHGRGRGR